MAEELPSVRKPDPDAEAGGEPLCRPVKKSGKYSDPVEWGVNSDMSVFDLMKAVSKVPAPVIPSGVQLDRELPVRLNVDALVKSPPPNKFVYTWLGHAGVLLQVQGLNIYFDTVSAKRCSPVQFAGPARYRDFPFTKKLDDLPVPDVVMISHNHYDHLDVATIKHWGDRPVYLVPEGNAAWFRKMGIKRVIDMTWWDEVEIQGVRFVCTPVRHRSGRGILDQMSTLWSSWVVIDTTRDAKFFFGGDTAYAPCFKQIHARFGDFDLAAIPIGAYHPRAAFCKMHVDPYEAVQMFQDLHVKQSFGIHWGTFVLTREPVLEPREKLQDAMEKAGLTPASFTTLDIGETWVEP